MILLQLFARHPVIICAVRSRSSNGRSTNTWLFLCDDSARHGLMGRGARLYSITPSNRCPPPTKIAILMLEMETRSAFDVDHVQPITASLVTDLLS